MPDQQRERDPNELGALWERKTQNGNWILSGVIDGIDVICFENTRGAHNPKAPKWHVMRSTNPNNRDRRDERPRERDRDDRRDDRDRTREERPRDDRRYEGHASEDRARDDRGGRGEWRDDREPEHVREDPPYTRDDTPRHQSDNRRGPGRPASPARPRGPVDDA